MPSIALIGPHAVGKTTCAKILGERYSMLTVVHCDNAKPLYLPDKVVLLEGAADLANRWLTREAVEVINLTCSIRQFEQNMRERCQLRNKPYRDDYWTDSKLRYEAQDRAVNYLRKLGVDYTTFTVDDRERDWPVVIEHLKKAIRRLWNQGLRN